MPEERGEPQAPGEQGREAARREAAAADDRRRRELDAIHEGQFDRASDADRQRASQDLILACSTAAALVTLEPVPVVDLFFITPIQLAMVEGIARIYGYGLDKKSALEIFRAVRSSLFTQHATLITAKLVPGYGWLVSVSVANALTYAIGQMTDHYFRAGRAMLPREMRVALKRLYQERFERVLREKRREAGAWFQRFRR